MILMIAPGPDMVFGAMPSGAAYVSDPYSLIKIVNDSAADQIALQSAGCFTASPFGGWGTFGFQTLADLYAADAGSLFTGIVGYPQYTVATVFADSAGGNDGTWRKTGSGSGSGNWTQASTQTLASLSALIPDAVPWAGKTIAQMSQVKAAIYLIGEAAFLDVQNAVPASPFNSAAQQWNGGGIVTPTGYIGAVIASVLGYDTTQMNALWATAASLSY